MIKRLVLFTMLLALFINVKTAGQSKAEIRNNFYEAESSVLFEDYKEALPLYLQLLKTYPDNANFKYRIGQCYINIPGEKAKAISYLEEAVSNIDPKYQEGKFKEAGAPYDALKAS
jgi:tetratricopeptide (TPR) repeat protein